MPLGEVLREPPADVGRSRAARARLRQRAPDRARARRARRRGARRRRRPPPRQHAVRLGRTSSSPTPPRPRRSSRDLLARARTSPLTPQIAEALYIGLVTDTGPLPVREHDAEGAAARRRPRRGGSGRARDLQARLRDGAVREAEAARPRARARAGLRGRAARHLVPRCAPTSPRPGPRSRSPRGSSTSCARARARSSWR